MAERLLRVSGSAVPAETQSALRATHFSMKLQQRSRNAAAFSFQEESVNMRQLRLRGTREGKTDDRKVHQGSEIPALTKQLSLRHEPRSLVSITHHLNVALWRNTQQTPVGHMTTRITRQPEQEHPPQRLKCKQSHALRR